MRIAVGGFQHETNTFASQPTTWQDFVQADTWPGLCQGQAMLDAFQDVNIPLSGFLRAARQYDCVLAPLAWSAAGPGGTVSSDAYEAMSQRLLDGLRAAGPVDAVYLDLHGAMVAAHAQDGEGELLRRVRACIGPDIPLVISLDLHANVSADMLALADLAVAYRTYPHVDMAQTGAEVCHALMRRVAGGRRWHVAWRRLPFLVPLCWQDTGSEPARGLYAALQAHDRPGQVLSLAMGFPAADVPDCGPVVWGYGEEAASVEAAVAAMAAVVLAAEPDFHGDILSPEQAVAVALAHGRAHSGPVVIADAQDNPGAGGSSDTMGLIRALHAQGADNAVCGLIVDPDAAARAHAVGQGGWCELALGGKSGVPGDAPLQARYLVERLHHGTVQATGAVFQGYTLELGPCACLRLGGIRILVASRKIQMLDLALIRFMGIDPAAAAILAIKSAVHFRADFAPLASRILICAAPGAFPLDPATLAWTRLAPGMRLRPNGPTVAVACRYTTTQSET